MQEIIVRDRHEKTELKLRRAGAWIVDHIPTAVIIALAAAYYISLSHLG